MSEHSLARRYMNTMAGFLLIMESSPIPITAYEAVVEEQRIPADEMEKLEETMKRSLAEGVGELERRLDEIVHSDRPERYVHAFQLTVWMDEHISYAKETPPGMLSLGDLIPDEGEDPVITGALNENYSETKIWINPKIDIVNGFFYAYGKAKKRSLFNRDVFRRMNGVLNHVSYFRWDGKNTVRNIILPIRGDTVRNLNEFKVAFSPILGFDDPLELGEYPMEHEGIRARGIALDGYRREEDEIRHRFEASWKRACEEGASLYFGAEMMGVPSMYEEEDGHLPYLKELCREAERAGFTPPTLTILPGRWQKQKGSEALLVYRDGRILGWQKRHTRFIDKADHMVEYMEFPDIREFCIVHFPGFYRIGTLICAEFLPQEASISVDLLCKELGCNLLIVPSYSAGEHDYVNSIPAVKPYGTSVIWGNCCGAVQHTPKIIGAVSIAGTDYVGRFGSVCRCRYTCRRETGCLYLARLPLVTQVDKPDSMALRDVIDHMVFDLS